MCELLGVSSLYPVTLEMSFQGLMQHTNIANPDGWGAVFYEKNDAYVFREPRPGNTSPLANLLGQCSIPSQIVISHIRKATSGPVELRNTHPFTREIHGRLHSFAFNGDVPDVYDMDLGMDRFCPIGETDGEFAFCWLMEQLLSQVDTGDYKDTSKILHKLGDRLAPMGPANFLYSDSRRLYAFASRRTHPDGMRPPGLYYQMRQCKEAETVMPCVGLNIQSSIDRAQQLCLIASVPLSDEEWIPFEANQLIAFDKGKVVYAE